MPEWIGCRYCCARVHVEWMHFEIEAETWTCFHHGRTEALAMAAAKWVRVTEEEWLDEPSRLTGAL